MRAALIKSNWLLIILLAYISNTACAQVRFKKGDEFQRQVLTRSNCVMQRGGQSLHVSSSSIVAKTYKVTDASENGATMIITTDKLTDTINAMDQTMIYHSEKPADPASDIQVNLQKIAKTSPTITVNNKGEIFNVKRAATVNDTLLSFTGLQLERLVPGAMLQFMANFAVNPSLKKGYSWTDNTPSKTTTYTVYAVNGRTITITYKTSILGQNLNSRINGSILIDNNTGIILKRYSQSVSTGYEIVNGIVYTATRRTAVTEVNLKK
ncbi:hypothetical protein [Mucilaginibacter sp. AK015]|uniref:hypothetical protein n=1 Tax=Mucilaginibacter sp. AK015 TaxID=2723072 RepID=UPI00160BD73B|nr:hypothetical protein [Mucilaginibacter sp. AK015]MBB5396721.1 hypothetical protein [Mucilaginibacter sp. AK015]